MGGQRLGWACVRGGQDPGVGRYWGGQRSRVGRDPGWVDTGVRAMGEQRLWWACASGAMGGQRPSVGGDQG